tara:strand:- start:82 stop:216 length:135 start_codon:yes stop_codon:yes gene_type:complete
MHGFNVFQLTYSLNLAILTEPSHLTLNDFNLLKLDAGGIDIIHV